MKALLSVYFLLMALSGFSQKQKRTYAAEETSPQLLAKKLTASAKNEKEKVDAIFYWITQNIAYNTGILYAVPRRAPFIYPKEAEEDTGALAPLNDRVAENVLRRRVAVCDGYARLFQSLCAHANIRAEIVTGYVRTGARTPNFRSNHTWNAVQIDSVWYLLDATWASGYVTFGNAFVPHFDARYFLASPLEFLADHYPEDPRWTLLSQPPAPKEFNSTPFKYLAFMRFKIDDFSPSSGVIQAAPGDTIKIELQTKYGEKSLVATTLSLSDSLLDSLSKNSPTLVQISGEKISYRYAISAQDGGWLYVLYNNEPVLRYQLQIRKDPFLALSESF